jgi:hypothetical protein
MDAGMSEKDEILRVLRAGLPDLQQRWPIRSLALFGSKPPLRDWSDAALTLCRARR